MSTRRPAVIGLALLASFATAWGLDDQAPLDWIRKNAIVLGTPESGHGFEDLAPLKKLIGDARIVSLGEATHGTREMFQLKHRMLEFLATQMGFTIFSIEANMPEAYRLNEYVLNGTGDPAELLRGLYFWTWNTEEVLDMIRWMREFNRSGKGPVQFTGFDMQTTEVAAEIVRDFTARYDSAYLPVVRDASTRAIGARSGNAGPSFGLATGMLPGSRLAGRKIRYSGHIKTENVTDGYAGLWWRVDGASGTLKLDNMSDRGAAGTTDWRPYEVEMTVDPGAKSVYFGALMPGKGTAWFDDLSIEVDGQPYVDEASFDFGFESRSVRGFFTGGRGYQVSLDASGAHSGKQSLRMVGGEPAKGADKPLAASVRTEWKAIVTHLEAGRPAFRTAGVASSAVDWAIQNARVVEQALESRDDHLARDRSMATNVGWILDQNPKARIVLWAHDGHVAAGGLKPGYAPMGSHLRKTHGSKMVAFGFAFNQGSFQAIEQGVGKLRDFTVPPAPANSLDAALSAAGLPMFALDLRTAPAWFNGERKSRQIGAAFSDQNAGAYVMDLRPAEAFDALFFIEKTTAARKNPAPKASPSPAASKPSQ